MRGNLLNNLYTEKLRKKTPFNLQIKQLFTAIKPQ